MQWGYRTSLSLHTPRECERKFLFVLTFCNRPYRIRVLFCFPDSQIENL
jgi:hypothetical protein